VHVERGLLYLTHLGMRRISKSCHLEQRLRLKTARLQATWPVRSLTSGHLTCALQSAAPERELARVRGGR
jgi:hypothetical protein